MIGVDTRSRDSYHTQVVKLGTNNAVGRDYEGCFSCVVGTLLGAGANDAGRLLAR